MAKLIAAPTVVPAAGTKPKVIEELVGRVNSGTSSSSSRLWMLFVSAGCERWIASAARSTVPCSTTAMKWRICRMSIAPNPPVAL